MLVTYGSWGNSSLLLFYFNVALCYTPSAFLGLLICWKTGIRWMAIGLKPKHTYIAHMRFLPFSWFSMKLGMINSFLIVCFTMVQKKIFKSENLYKIHTKISRNGYKTTFRGKCITFTINTRENFPIIFTQF